MRTALTPLLAATALLVTLLGGCAATPEPVPYARPFPADVTQTETLNIQVFRRTYDLQLTNTTDRTFGPSTLWLNARFCRPIDGLTVGQTLVIPLREFRDQYSDWFRTGGFFSSEAPERLVLAQIETRVDGAAPKLVGLIVVRAEEE